MKFSSFYLALLVVIFVPIVLVFQGYEWKLDQDFDFPFLQILTETSSGIYSIITAAILSLIILWYTRKNWRLGVAVIAYTAVIIVGTQAAKSIIKNKIQQPRPFITEVVYYLAKDSVYQEVLGKVNLAWYSTHLNKLIIPAEQATQSQQSPQQPTTPVAPSENATPNEDLEAAVDSILAEQEDTKDDINSNPAYENIFICKDCSDADEWKDNIEKIENLYNSLTDEQKVFFIEYLAQNKLIKPTLSLEDYTNSYINKGYSLAEAKKLATEEYNRETDTIAKQLKRLAHETGYSTPSGHSLFVSVWMIIFIILAINSRNFTFALVTLLVVLWGTLVQASRIVLGYHYTYDVLFSALIAAVVISLTFWIVLLLIKILYKIFPPRNSSHN